MAHITRKIGLSLGADICWPICYERLLKQLDLKLPINGNTVSFESSRVNIEPFDLGKGCNYDVVIDRLTHWYHTSREWIKKEILVNDLYVFNNPWSLQSMEKQTTYAAMIRLGFPVPDTDHQKHVSSSGETLDVARLYIAIRMHLLQKKSEKLVKPAHPKQGFTD